MKKLILVGFMAVVMAGCGSGGGGGDTAKVTALDGTWSNTNTAPNAGYSALLKTVTFSNGNFDAGTTFPSSCSKTLSISASIACESAWMTSQSAGYKRTGQFDVSGSALTLRNVIETPGILPGQYQSKNIQLTAPVLNFVITGNTLTLSSNGVALDSYVRQ